MRALGIRQSWAELILRGEKTIETRPMRTNKRGERVYIYAGLQRIEPEEEARLAAEFDLDIDALPRGVMSHARNSGVSRGWDTQPLRFQLPGYRHRKGRKRVTPEKTRKAAIAGRFRGGSWSA